MNDFNEILHLAEERIGIAKSVSELQQVRGELLGRQSLINQEMKKLGNLNQDERKKLGEAINLVKNQINNLLETKECVLEETELTNSFVAEKIDLTIPARQYKQGSIHPITQVTEELIQIFAKFGLSVKSGPTIENDWYNFTALNFGQEHPARQMHDTFYLQAKDQEDHLLLRTHTSPIQIRAMENEKPPFRFISPGRTYRSDYDMTHTPMFHQIEGLVVEENINMGHLKYIIIEFIRDFFEQTNIEVRFRPSFFPFTEPSAEVDIKMPNSNNWLEVLGCGMVHPNVLKNVDIDSKQYQGFAFGLGIERFAMLKYNIQDLRQFFEEVEEIIDRRAELKDFEVAHILKVKPHPLANKLQICEIQTKEGLLQIVCGASNARENIKVVLAKIGCLIPNGEFKIKESVIRGEKSSGMLCSEEELLLGGNSEGIIELLETAEIGEPLSNYYGIDDPVFNINVTPNRGDALGVYGIARDLAARGIGGLKEIEVPKIREDFQSNLNLEIKDKVAVRLFCIREIRDLQNRESPDWLKQLLQNIGVKSISAIVDITNYILYSFGQPMHAYDKNKFSDNIQVSLLQESAKFIALQGQEYNLEKDDLIVQDNNKQIYCLAGITGGAYGSCTLETSNIILEAASFSPEYITKTGRRLQIDTEARYRFERNIDQSFTLQALNIATELIVSICGGKASQIIYEGNIQPDQKSLEFPISCLAKITGMQLSTSEIINILEALGFIVQGQDSAPDILKILIPSWRHDINIKEDIIEEIVRVYGYDKLKAIKLPDPIIIRTVSLEQKRIIELKRILASCGYDEVVTNSFMSSKTAKLFTTLQEELFLLNPLNTDNNYMRPSIIPNLLTIAQKNSLRSLKDSALMEIGPIFNSCAPEGELLFAAGIKCGQYNHKDYHSAGRLFDVFDVKADLETSLNYIKLSLDKCQFSKVDLPYYHPTKSSAVKLGKNIIAYFGQVHPAILKYFDIKKEIFAFEINMSNVPLSKLKFPRKDEFVVSDFQPTFRDYAFVVNNDQPVGEIINCIKKLDKKIIRSVDLFDVYAGDKLPFGKKSVAIKVKLQSADRTLNESDLKQLSEMIISNVEERFQGKLRE
ncbi:Phenylalanine--tRNA ligase beta subunit [Pseudolycoriella hygida]|uniref:Phenylalanine--tRNA ligase alpha subunit n=1 Tax=Pseudolycoriella hygida TaxID=35572 RepID=A0A9Q0N8E8_9DIPT|nr:Phenylalanine--tRNA ligase beta subunit [Pseudolycoriella hygida]